MLFQNSVIQIGNYCYYPSKIIGKGATGTVYQGFRNKDNFTVAVKIIPLQQLNTPAKKHLLNCEIAGLRAIKNRYICECFDILMDPQYYYIVMQFCPNGTLFNYVKRKGALSQRQSLQIFQKILEGYCAIQKAGFIHRDIKTQNVLFTSNFQPVIIDFGYCQNIITQGLKQAYNVGSPAYMSPESYNENMYSEKSDVWSLGIILLEMLTGGLAVWRTEDPDLYFKDLAKKKTAQIKPLKNQSLTRIILSTLSIRLQQRPTASQLKNMISSIKNGSSNSTKSSMPHNNLFFGKNSMKLRTDTQQVAMDSQIISINKNISSLPNFINKGYSSSNSENFSKDRISSQSFLSLNSQNHRFLSKNNKLVLNQVQNYQHRSVQTSQLPQTSFLKNQRVLSYYEIPSNHPEPSRLVKTYSTNKITFQKKH